MFKQTTQGLIHIKSWGLITFKRYNSSKVVLGQIKILGTAEANQEVGFKKYDKYYVDKLEDPSKPTYTTTQIREMFEIKKLYGLIEEEQKSGQKDRAVSGFIWMCYSIFIIGFLARMIYLDLCKE